MDRNARIANRRRRRMERSIATVRPFPTVTGSQKLDGQHDHDSKLTRGLPPRLRLQEGTVFDLRKADSGYERLPDVQQIASPSLVLERVRRLDPHFVFRLLGGLSRDNLFRECPDLAEQRYRRGWTDCESPYWYTYKQRYTLVHKAPDCHQR